MKALGRAEAMLLFWATCLSFANGQVTGVVRDAGTMQPLPGALVTIQATTVRTMAAADGSYSLPASSGSSLVVAGAHKGYYNGGVMVTAPAAAVDVLLDPVPTASNPAYALAAPSACGLCHPDQYDEWLGSPMSLGGLNTWVYDIFDGSGTAGGLGGFVYTRDSVFATSNPASECAACHEPEAWLIGGHVPISPFTSGTPSQVHGVSCEVCHKIADVDVTRMNYPGVVSELVEFTRPASALAQVQYGLLGDVTYHSPGIMRAAYQPQLSAEVCGACHQDKNDPDGDGDFEEANGVISEPTYWEWKNSPYGDPQSPYYADCLACHMPPSGADQVCVVLNPPLSRAPGTVRTHDIRGTTPDFLENAVSLTASSQVAGDRLLVDVTLENTGTGHHVPTGVTVRNMILLVEAVRSDTGAELPLATGPTVSALGGVGDPAQGYYAGLPGRLYAKVNQNAQGQGPTFFTDAVTIVEDNRLPPLGLDDTSYEFELPSGGGNVEISVRVIYRRAWRALVDAKGWMYDGHGAPLADVAPPHYGHLMESSDITVNRPASADTFLRGDTNLDGSVDVADAVTLLAYLFLAQSPVVRCLDAADSNDSGGVDIADAITILGYLFGNGSTSIPAPGPTLCGVDPTGDGNDCDFYAASACP
ncbi:MAG: hypothetical protein AB7O52_03345 [Planctomycetota bacterium]